MGMKHRMVKRNKVVFIDFSHGNALALDEAIKWQESYIYRILLTRRGYPKSVQSAKIGELP